jgi:hypothetical protein
MSKTVLLIRYDSIAMIWGEKGMCEDNIRDINRQASMMRG